MNVYVIADLHLAIACPEKSMEVFGWTNYMEKIATHWKSVVKEGDLVLLPGDISWAMNLQKAKPDLDWIEALPGTKVMIKGNHDYWWDGIGKVRKALPPSIHAIQNDSFDFGDLAIAGARLWDSPEYSFNEFIAFTKPPSVLDPAELEENEKIFARELERLEMSLKSLKPQAKVKICMTHYPPIGADLVSSKTSQLLEKYGVNICLFGHLHNVKSHALPFGEKGGVKYHLTSCDYLDFKLLKII